MVKILQDKFYASYFSIITLLLSNVWLIKMSFKSIYEKIFNKWYNNLKICNIFSCINFLFFFITKILLNILSHFTISYKIRIIKMMYKL